MSARNLASSLILGGLSMLILLMLLGGQTIATAESIKTSIFGDFSAQRATVDDLTVNGQITINSKNGKSKIRLVAGEESPFIYLVRVDKDGKEIVSAIYDDQTEGFVIGSDNIKDKGWKFGISANPNGRDSVTLQFIDKDSKHHFRTLFPNKD